MADVRILVLMWKMEAGKDKPAQITRDEWALGCQRLNVDSMEKLKQLLPGLDTGFLESHEFREFYKVGFFFHIFLMPKCCFILSFLYL